MGELLKFPGPKKENEDESEPVKEIDFSSFEEKLPSITYQKKGLISLLI